MNTTAAADHIDTALIAMENSVGQPIFNEWALVEKNDAGWNLIEYRGDRKDGFLAAFNDDMAALRNTLDPSSSSVGDFAFSHEGFGSGFDAHICAGNDLYVLLNNTTKSTDEITDNPRWTMAQIHFTELLERFIADPLAV